MATETVYPATDLPGRYKKKLSTAEVIDRFVDNRQHEAQSANLYLDRGVLFSGGPHYPLARWVRNTTGGLAFVLVRSAGGAAMTVNKHRPPLLFAVAQRTDFFTFIVDCVDRDADADHAENLAHRVQRAEVLAEAARHSAKDRRRGKAWGAIDHLFVSFMYANRVLTGGWPDAEMPHGVLRDWLEEKMPKCGNLINAAHLLATTQNPNKTAH